MKKDLLRFMVIMLICAIFITGCGGNAPAASTPGANSTEEAEDPTASVSTTGDSTTADPCVSPQIEAEAQKVHRHMREFDDASNLAAALPQAQLGDSIATMQRIRREADDEPVPTCLTALKNYEIQHMNAAIETFLTILRLRDAQSIDCANAANNAEQQVLCRNFALASQYRDQYLLELTRVLGITVAPATPGAATAPAETPTIPPRLQ
jgi:hypothetical protein